MAPAMQLQKRMSKYASIPCASQTGHNEFFYLLLFYIIFCQIRIIKSFDKFVSPRYNLDKNGNHLRMHRH